MTTREQSPPKIIEQHSIWGPPYSVERAACASPSKMPLPIVWKPGQEYHSHMVPLVLHQPPFSIKNTKKGAWPTSPCATLGPIFQWTRDMMHCSSSRDVPTPPSYPVCGSALFLFLLSHPPRFTDLFVSPCNQLSSVTSYASRHILPSSRFQPLFLASSIFYRAFFDCYNCFLHRLFRSRPTSSIVRSG